MRVRLFDKSGLRLAELGSLACLFALAAVPQARAANSVGWVLVDQPDFTGNYTPDSAHSFNSAHGSVTVGASGKGSYSVAFDNLLISPSTPGNIEVTAYNSPNRCATSYPQVSGNTVGAGVQCYDQAGTPANTGFSLLYQTRSTPFGSASNALAFLEQERTTDVTAVNDSFNSTAGGNTVVKSSKTGIGAGNYTVTLGGLTHAGGDVQVSGWVNSAQYGGTAHCKVQNWSAASKGTTITVQCYRDDNGNPTYSAFNLAYAIGEPFGLVTGEATLGAWLWAQDLTSTTPYKPNPHFQYNGFRTGIMTAQKTSTGHYTVTIPGTLTYTSSIALAAAYGPGNGYCNVAGWTGGIINVVCYDQNHNFADSRFNLTFQTAR